MDCNRARELLERIASAKAYVSIDDSEQDHLHAYNLIDIIPQADYAEIRKTADRYKKCYEHCKDLEEGLEDLKADKQDADKKLSSPLYRVFSVLKNGGTSRIEWLRNYSARLQDEIRQTQKELDQQRAVRDRCQIDAALCESLVPCKGKYCAITTEGMRILRALHEAHTRLSDVTLETFCTERSAVLTEARERLTKRDRIIESLHNEGYRSERHVASAALTLVGSQYEADIAMQRLTTVCESLAENGWQDDQRLRPAAVTACTDGAIGNACDALMRIFRVMADDGHIENYTTMHEAARLLRASGDSAEMRYKRFASLQRELHSRDWEERAKATGHIATALACKEGQPAELADAFRELEKVLIEHAGIDDCPQSGFAALVLLEVSGFNKQRSQRLRTALEKLAEYGWASDRRHYPVAAALAAMPGTVGENVHLLSEVDQMVADVSTFTPSDQARTSVALSLLTGSYQQLANRTDAPGHLQTSNTSANAVHDGIMPAQNLAVWLITFDMIDNGVLDFVDPVGIAGGVGGDGGGVMDVGGMGAGPL